MNAGPSARGGAGGLLFSGPASARRRLRNVRHVMGDSDGRHVLPLLGLAETRTPAGLVVVFAPNGVAPERWTPVFMYASLS